MITPQIPRTGLVVTIPENTRESFLRICKSKQITPEHAASLMIYSACRSLDELPPSTGTDLLADLEFSKGMKQQAMKRLDQLIGVAERVILDSQGINRALRNRNFNEK